MGPPRQKMDQHFNIGMNNIYFGDLTLLVHHDPIIEVDDSYYEACGNMYILFELDPGEST